MERKPILIIGGNGKTGRRVDKILRGVGYATRPVSRSTEPRFDWTDRATWEKALKDVSAVYLTYQPDLAVPKAAEDIQAFCALAKFMSVKRVVMLSGRGEKGAIRAENILKQSGLDWTIVRSSWFSNNFSENFFLEGVLSGQLALPTGDVKEPFIDADDIAEVVAVSFMSNRHVNRLYEVTGPESITFPQAVETISKLTGRQIDYHQITNEEFVGGLVEAGLPDDLISLLEELFTEVLDGRNSRVCRGVEEALGRKPKSFQQYVIDTMKTGVWEAGK